MSESKVIYAHVYNPRESLFKGNRNDKAQLFTVSCSNSENCGLFKRGECCRIGTFGSRCPYGTNGHKNGYTPKARAFSQWILDNKAKYSYLTKPSLTSPKKIMTVIDGYVYLPYPHMNLNDKVPFLEKGSLFNHGSDFIKTDDFTIENIVKICSYRPQALMGGEIKSYQDESVPLFLLHLREQFKELYEQLVETYPRAAEILSKHTNVGRKARLGSLTPNVGTFNETSSSKVEAHWVWDGEYLTSVDKKTSFLIVYNFSEIRIKPSLDAVVTITDEAQVNESTIFES